MRRSGDQFDTFWSDDGSLDSPAVAIVRSFTWVLNRFYHVATSRDNNNDIRMFIDGAQLGAAVNVPFDMHYHADVGPLRLGGFDSTGDQILSAYLDEWSITTNEFYDADFTPTDCIRLRTLNEGFRRNVGRMMR